MPLLTEYLYTSTHSDKLVTSEEAKNVLHFCLALTNQHLATRSLDALPDAKATSKRHVLQLNFTMSGVRHDEVPVIDFRHRDITDHDGGAKIFERSLDVHVAIIV